MVASASLDWCVNCTMSMSTSATMPAMTPARFLSDSSVFCDSSPLSSRAFSSTPFSGIMIVEVNPSSSLVISGLSSSRSAPTVSGVGCFGICSVRYRSALNAFPQLPQQTFPAACFRASAVTLKAISQSGHWVYILVRSVRSTFSCQS